jgi:hypothetical protein
MAWYTSTVHPLGEYKQEFLAKFLGDLAKAIFTVGIASVFFRDFPLPARIVLWTAFGVLALVSIIIHPHQRR